MTAASTADSPLLDIWLDICTSCRERCGSSCTMSNSPTSKAARTRYKGRHRN